MGIKASKGHVSHVSNVNTQTCNRQNADTLKKPVIMYDMWRLKRTYNRYNAWHVKTQKNI